MYAASTITSSAAPVQTSCKVMSSHMTAKLEQSDLPTTGWLRGRTRIPRSRIPLCTYENAEKEHVEQTTSCERILKPDIYLRNGKKEDVSNESNDVLVRSETTAAETQIKHVDMRPNAYPPYLRTSFPPWLLVKGSTCKLIMQLHESALRGRKLARSLARKAKTENYSPAEIDLIIQTCMSLGLSGSSPLATEDWENEPIEGWWFKEDSYCEALRRQIPVSEEVAGYECNDGWWRDKQNKGFRDWDRWAESSIGPESRRKRGSAGNEEDSNKRKG